MTLTAAEPAEFSMGDDDWTLRIESDGEPASGVAFVVHPWMPEHSHGAVKAVLVNDDGGGEYEATPIDVNMVGIWEIRIEFPSDGSTPLRTVFPFCVSSK